MDLKIVIIGVAVLVALIVFVVKRRKKNAETSTFTLDTSVKGKKDKKEHKSKF